MENKSSLGERTESYTQRARREHGGQGSGAHALHTVIWSVARGNHNTGQMNDWHVKNDYVGWSHLLVGLLFSQEGAE